MSILSTLFSVLKSYDSVIVRSDEIVPGTKKPSIILAQMMAATILEELPGPETEYGGVYSMKTSKFDFKFQKVLDRNTGKYEFSGEYFYHSFQGIKFSKQEQKILFSAFQKSQELREARDKILAEEAAQHKALDAIQTWCKIPTGSVECHSIRLQPTPANRS